MSAEKVSTSALAKRRGVSVKAVFAELSQRGWIVRLNEQWELTNAGRQQGGEVVSSERFGQYIVWPDSLALDEPDGLPASTVLPARSHVTVSQLAEPLGISPAQLNTVLAELHWIKRAKPKGWELTHHGAFYGGLARETKDNIPYVIWPDNLLEQPVLKHSVGVVAGELSSILQLDRTYHADYPDFLRAEQQQAANFLSLDGHAHRYLMTQRVDNWLYLAGINHAINRSLSFDMTLVSDFYLPDVGVYIECVDRSREADYLKFIDTKRQRYKKAGLTLIELSEADTQQLDAVLPRLLKPLGVEFS